MRKLRVILLVLMLPAGIAAHFGWLQASGNFHIVADGKLYRSAQPSSGDLAAYAKTYGLRSVINLRGAHPGEPWYDEEMRASNELGLRHIDLALSARRELTPTQRASLKMAFSEAPAPILVHCKSGADRTGLAAALFLLEIERVSVNAAAAQLSIRYGHWPYFPSGSAAMDRTFEQEAEKRRWE
ncbi:MAG: dual specificity protein phosphatase family protein [Rhodomicrobium sp.]|jgi:protein tyrosine/serine phosphatase